MTSYVISIELPDGKLKEIMKRIDKAQDELYKCYSELERLGVLTIREDASGN